MKLFKSLPFLNFLNLKNVIFFKSHVIFFVVKIIFFGNFILWYAKKVQVDSGKINK